MDERDHTTARRSALLVSGHPPGTGSGSSNRGRVTLDALRSHFDHVDALSLHLPGEERGADPAVRLVPRPGPAPGTQRLFALAGRGLFYLPEWQSELARHARELIDAGELRSEYDLIWVHSSLVAGVARECFEAPAAVLDIDNVAGAEARQAANGFGALSPRGLFRRADARAVAREERRRCDQFDRVVLTSPEEERRLGPVRAPVEILPNTLAFASEPLAPDASRTGGLFVGSLEYAPNVDALRFLVTDVLPRLQTTHPDATLTVAGRNPTPEVKTLCEAPGVRLVADAPTLEPLYREAAVVLAPLRLGGGTRFKLIEAMAYGAAIVATPTAAEGLELRGGREALLAEDAAALATAWATLLDDPGSAAALGRAARAAYERDHRPEIAADHVVAIAQELLDDA